MTNSVLYISSPRQHHEGYYYCEASNKHGVAVSQRARLDVLGYSIGLPRLIIALNLTSKYCQASNVSSSLMHNPQSCDYNSTLALPSSINKNETDNMVYFLARSLDVSGALITQFEYNARNNATATVAFILHIDLKPWKVDNFTSYLEIAEAIAVAQDNMRKKLEQFNSDIK